MDGRTDAPQAIAPSGASATVAQPDVSDEAPAEVEIRKPWYRRIGAPEAVLAVLVTAWSATFIHLPQLRHDRYGTFGFDLGIYDQGVWLLSRFKDPFVTVRGLELFGHHANIFLLLLVPFYWLGAGPIFLLVVQVLAQASGAVAIFLLGRDLLKSKWAGVGLAATLLLNPTYQWLTWEFFHPDAVSIGPLLFAYWAARRKRWRIFTVAAVLALLCKEDVALSLFVLGLIIAFRGERRRGAIVAAVSAVWFVFATRVFIPWQNGIGPFYDTFFGDLGKTPTEVMYNAARHPTKTWDLASAQDRRTWYWKMLAPWALLPLLDPAVLVIALPMIFVGIVTSFPYTRDYRFHYSSLVLAGTAVATVEAIAWIARRAKDRFDVTRNVLVTVVLFSAFLSTQAWGASPLARDYRHGMWPLHYDPRVAVKAEAIRHVPARAAVSVPYNLTTHMAHREHVYEFPVPWCNVNWGVHGEHLDDPGKVQYLLIDRQLVSADRDEALLSDLLSSEFRIVWSRDDLLVAKRIKPTAYPTNQNPPEGACYPRPSLDPYQ
jgi:uncharacterized membrane protein